MFEEDYRACAYKGLQRRPTRLDSSHADHLQAEAFFAQKAAAAPVPLALRTVPFRSMDSHPAETSDLYRVCT